MLDLNSSFIWIFFLILLLYLVLNRIFFKPVQAIIAKRETKVAADANRLETLMAEIEVRTRSVEDQLGQARQDARQIKEKWLEDGERVRSRAVAAARENASRVLSDNIGQLESEIAMVEQALEKQISVFSDKIQQAYL